MVGDEQPARTKARKKGTIKSDVLIILSQRFLSDPPCHFHCLILRVVTMFGPLRYKSSSQGEQNTLRGIGCPCAASVRTVRTVFSALTALCTRSDERTARMSMLVSAKTVSRT